MSVRRLDFESWLTALLAKNTRVHLERAGFTKYGRLWNTTNRALDEHLLWLVVQGAFEGLIAGKSVRLDTGTLMWLSPHIQHHLSMLETELPTAVYNLRIEVNQGDTVLALEPQALTLREAWSARPIFESILQAKRVPAEFQDHRVRALITLLSATAFDLAQRPAMTARTFNNVQKQKIVRLIEERAARPLSAAMLAQEFRMSRDYFSVLFRRTFGLAPRAWIKRERIRAAARKLTESNLNVTEVAYAFGYRDIFLFSRQFKQVYGCSPKAYLKDR